MCEYISLANGKCYITKEQCPYAYFCNKIQSYKILQSMPKNCKQKQLANIPSNSYQVCFERNGKLYIDVEGFIEIIKNPFDYTPLFVKMTKLKSGKWKIKQGFGGD